MLTFDEAHKVFRLDEASGELYWRHCGRKRTLSKPAGHTGVFTSSSGRGYRRVWYNGKKYLVHRVIWLMVSGDWPQGTIDHIDGNKRNNKPDNLQDVCTATNTRLYWSRQNAHT